MVSSALVRSAGVLADGRVWTLEDRGRLAIGANVFELDALCIDMIVEPGDRRALVRVDLMDLRSTARIIDLTTGATLWAPKTRARAGPRAGAASVKDGKLRLKGRASPLAEAHGEVMLAASKTAVMLVDAAGLRVFDIASGEATHAFTPTELESWTIDPIDKRSSTAKASNA